MFQMFLNLNKHPHPDTLLQLQELVELLHQQVEQEQILLTTNLVTIQLETLDFLRQEHIEEIIYQDQTHQVVVQLVLDMVLQELHQATLMEVDLELMEQLEPLELQEQQEPQHMDNQEPEHQEPQHTVPKEHQEVPHIPNPNHHINHNHQV